MPAFMDAAVAQPQVQVTLALYAHPGARTVLGRGSVTFRGFAATQEHTKRAQQNGLLLTARYQIAKSRRAKRIRI